MHNTVFSVISDEVLTHFKVIIKNPISFSFLVIGFLNALLTFYPGSMSVDSYNQFYQAVSGVYDDWHPPVMAWLWRHLLWIKEGPQPMLLLHLGLFWGGLYLIWRMLAEKKSWCRILVPMIGFMPPVIGMVGVIWKDIGLGSTILMTIGLWNSLQDHFKLRAFLVSLLLIYASWVRHNSIALTAPFIMAIPWFPDFPSDIKSRKSPRYRLGLGVVLVLTVVVANKIFDYRILEAHRTFPITGLILNDISKIEEETQQEILPEIFKTKNYSKDKVHLAVNDRNTWRMIYPGDAPVRIPPGEKENSELKQLWLSNIFLHFTPYMKYRWFHFQSLMRMGYGQCYANHFYMPEKFGGGLSYMKSWRNYLDEKTTQWAADTPLFSGWFYMVFALIGLGLSFWSGNKNNLLAQLCFVSVLSYPISYFLSSVSCDLRYVWPVTFITAIGWVLLLADLKIPKLGKKLISFSR